MSHTDAAAVPRLALTGDPQLTDRRGYPRSRATLPSFRAGKAPGNKGKRYPPEIHTAEEVYRLIEALGDIRSRDHALRNQALIMTLWRVGLRISEALDLEPKDIDWTTRRITVLCGKNSKRRVCAMDAAGFEYLERWRERRIELGILSGKLFCVLSGPTKGGRLGSSQVRGFLYQARTKAGIDKAVRPHLLRHDWATFQAKNRTPLRYVQLALGHSNLAVTERYLSGMAPEDMLDFIAEVEWPEAA